MRKKISIIVGGSGQLGICLAQVLLKKKYKVIITTRSLAQAKKKIPIINKNLKISKLDILNKKKIDFFYQKNKPKSNFLFCWTKFPNIVI